jgi:hypothetical protein
MTAAVLNPPALRSAVPPVAEWSGPHAGWIRGETGAVRPLHAAAGAYVRLFGVPTPVGAERLRRAADYRQLAVDTKLAERIAATYLDSAYRDTFAARYPDETRRAYAAFIRETEQQYRWLTDTVGMRFSFVRVDPYATDDGQPDPMAMHADLARGQLAVWRTDAGSNPHPLMSAEENDRFRAVHDTFGHGAIGSDFGQLGEDAAWSHHAGMYRPLARRALTTETRGQSAAIFTRGAFPDQFATLLPGWAQRIVMGAL